MTLNIKPCYSTTSLTYALNRSIKYIALHYTAGTTSKAGTALGLAKWFASGGNPSNPASSDFIVDDRDIVQYNKDIENRYAWCVGGAKYSPTTSLGASLYGKATNKNTINIEICSNKLNKKSLLASDTDWYFTDETLNNTRELVKYLMEKYNIPIERVIMHHCVTGKPCPAMWTHNEAELKGYYDFLQSIDKNYKSVTVSKPTSTTTTMITLPYKAKVKIDSLNVRSGAGLGNPVILTIKKNEVYTIVEEKKIKNTDGSVAVWGLLKAYQTKRNGWINVGSAYVTKIK
jgi:N-acetylmuramoyl-L-alanine amidase CwlA